MHWCIITLCVRFGLNVCQNRTNQGAFCQFNSKGFFLSPIGQAVLTILLCLQCCDTCTWMSSRWPLFARLKPNQFLNDWKWQFLYICKISIPLVTPTLDFQDRYENNFQLEAIYSKHPSFFFHVEKTHLKLLKLPKSSQKEAGWIVII